jgi:diaminopimelate decarboxylase
MKTERHPAAARFPVVDGELTVGGLPLSLLAARVGRTPFYAYDRRLLDARVSELRSAMPAAVQLHFAMKANPMPALVQHMARQVDGIDVASAGELRVALDAGMDPSHISFAGPAKGDVELMQAVAAGVLVNIESMREIGPLARTSQQLGRPARAAVRVNPNFELKSSGMKMSGGPKQFGIDSESVGEALREIRLAGLAFEGFHIFSGSQSLRAESICEAQSKAVALAIELADQAPAPVRVLNIGGGFGIPHFPGDRPLELAAIGEHLEALVKDTAGALPEAKLVVELGRYMVGEAGVYVCRVVDCKWSRGAKFLVTDGGLHHHLSASGNFGQVLRKNYPVEIGTRMDTDMLEETSIVGPLCTPLDLLADRMSLPPAQIGDLVVVFQSGAYGFSASPHLFLGHPSPLEVLV